jgi:TolB-like protein
MRVLKSLSRSPVVIREIVALGEDLKRGVRNVKEVVTFDEEELTEDVVQARVKATASRIDALVRHQKKIALLNEKLETLNAKVKAREARKTRTAKLLDFGIAKQLQREGDPTLTTLTTLTGKSILIGTPAYMAPEQAECKAVDERSDIFSFGAVLCEMLCSRRAFPGTSAASILGAILHRPPDPLNTPPALNAIVSRCLEKDPERRYQSAEKLLTALEQATVSEKASDSQATHQAALETSTRLRPRRRLYATMAAAAALLLAAALGLDYWLHEHRSESSNSIAVLPLDMQSKEADAGYISDGIASSVNNRLAKLSVFRVIPNSVTQNYKGKTAKFQQIGKTLGVSTVLSGRVVQHGDNIFISIELNDVRDGKQIWGQQYSRKICDLLQLQNDIAREVSQRLRTQLSEADRQKMTFGSTTNPDAYRLYLKGVYYTAKFTKDGFDQGVDYLNQAPGSGPQLRTGLQPARIQLHQPGRLVYRPQNSPAACKRGCDQSSCARRNRR